MEHVRLWGTATGAVTALVVGAVTAPVQQAAVPQPRAISVPTPRIFPCLSVRGRVLIRSILLRTCRVPGCHEPATGFSAYCSPHKATSRRHGDPLQEGVTKAQLDPYVKIVEARITKNTNSSVWSQLDERWLALTGAAEAILSAYHNGRPGLRQEVLAAHEVKKLGNTVEPRSVIVTALAMYLMIDQEPRRFRSDAAFSTQLIRRIRGLSDVNVGEWHDSRSNKTRRVYRELPPRVVQVLAGWVVPVLGSVGIRLAALEKADHEAVQKQIASFQQAVNDLV